MIYDTYLIGGELYHAQRANHKYLDKVRTKSGKWRYIYTKAKDSKLALQEDKIDELFGKANIEKIVSKNTSNTKNGSIGTKTSAFLDKLNGTSTTKSSGKKSSGSKSSEKKSSGSKSSGKKSGGSKSSGKASSGSKSSGSKTSGTSKEKLSGSSSSSQASKAKEETSSNNKMSLSEAEQKIQKGIKKENEYYNDQKATLEKLYNTYKNQKRKTSLTKRQEINYKIKLRNLEQEHQETLAMYRKFMQFLKED